MYCALQLTFDGQAIMKSGRSKRPRDISPRAVFRVPTEAVVSALVVLEVAHGQRVRGDLLAALGERLDDVETRPRAELLILRTH